MTGILSLSAADYHDDRVADPPSLSASVAAILCTASPLHAWTAHPKLNPDFQRRDEEKFDLGTAAHALFLDRDGSSVQVIDAPDWRTNDAKVARDAARAVGRLPLLAKHWAQTQAMVGRIRDQLAAHDARPPMFDDGQPERTLVWEEDGGVVCRARLDWLRHDLAAIDDLKTTSRSANPEGWSRNLYSTGADLQAAFYLRGVKALTGAEPVFRWCVVENSPPFALSVVTPGMDVLAVARSKVDFALDLWRGCLETGKWPAYPARVFEAELPPWADDARWLVNSEGFVA